MNFFKKFYSRAYQFVFKVALPFLPYRTPQLLSNYEELMEALKETSTERVFVVTDKTIRKLNLTKELEKTLKKGKVEYFIFDDVKPNPTTQNVEDGLSVFVENNCDGIIALGGGSVIDCAKAVGARVANPNKTLQDMRGILKVKNELPPLIAIPTTAGTGSETTLASVIVDEGTREKYAINDFPLIPKYAMLDENLTKDLPPFVTATTGLDALTHAVEAFIGRSTTRETRENAIIATKLIFENLVEAYKNGENLNARKNMLMASYHAGLSFTKSYVGYVHAIAHSLGGKYDVAHGLANAVILPVVLRAYGKKIEKKLWKLGVECELIGDETPLEEGANIVIEKIESLNRALDIPTTIDEIKIEDIEELAKRAEKEANPLYPVPVLWGVEELTEIYYKIKPKEEVKKDE